MPASSAIRSLGPILVAAALWPALPAASPAGPPEVRQPVPSPDTQEDRLRLLREVFGEELDHADTPEKKRALADALLKTAIKTPEDASSRYVLLRIARDAAASAGDARKAMDAADAIADAFQLGDALQMKADTLERTAPLARTPEQSAALATAAVDLAGDAIALDRYGPAGRLADLALEASRKCRHSDFIKRVTTWRKEVEVLRDAYAEVSGEFTALESNPADPEANLAVGRFLALSKGEWNKAVAYLALGSDADLKALAQEELRAPVAPADQVALADQWWRLAEEAQGAAAGRLRAHAAEWYRRVLPRLSGLAKAKAESRVAAADTSNLPEGAVTPPGRLLEQPIPGELTDLRAVYGTDEKAVDVTEIVRKMHAEDPFAPIHVLNVLLGDPAPYQTKRLLLRYRFGTRQVRRVVQEAQFETIPFLPAQGVRLRQAHRQFAVLAARYGAKDAWIDVTETVAKLVDDPAKPFTFGAKEAGRDPVFGLHKVLVVWFDHRGVRYVRVMQTETTCTLLP